MKILVGADPELFLSRDGDYISAHGTIAGTKETPYKVEGGAVQVDGMALEFNIDPAASLQEFKGNIDKVIGILADMSPLGASLEAVPTAHFLPEVMSSQPPEATELGCDPDYNAYSGHANEPPNGEVLFRTGAGHVHIGWTDHEDINDPEHVESCRNIAKQMDFMLGLPSMLWDTDEQRRSLYGMAGAFRPKPYGMEYRVLSNAWLTSPDLIEYVYSQVIRGVEELMKGNYYGGGNVQEIINNGLMGAASDIIIGNLDLFGSTGVLTQLNDRFIGVGMGNKGDSYAL